MTSNLGYYKLSPEVKSPYFATPGSACFDICAFLTSDTVKVYTKENSLESRPVDRRLWFSESDSPVLVLNPNERALVPTGLIFDIPKGFSIRLHIRSSLALLQGILLANGEAVIDSDYVEQTYVMLYNRSDIPFFLRNGDRICQGELVPVFNFELTEIADRPNQKTIRDGGFGSTGK